MSIIKFIKDNSDSNPKPQDVHNLVRKLKAREHGSGPSSSAKRLKKWMSEFGDVAGNVGRIFVGDVGEKTKHMPSVFNQFPEDLQIGTTHGANRSKYKGFSFMAQDTFGKDQFVQLSLLQNERWSTLLTALEEFKDNNPAWTKFRCVLIGKDFTELSVLKTAFLDVTILLCQFHVLKYLREEIASSDYGCNMWGGNQLRDLMNLLVYAKTDKEYMRHFRYMLHDSEAGRSISEQ
ncbi:hypothetical protein PC121_g1189 [Phytophthora cactorum]|nr:hypothetical protein PC120_g9284 [Phytophthora cactorum]KAG3102602.1 hypothetical protein PC121_g1189 [Phytophthora cactorum]